MLETKFGGNPFWVKEVIITIVIHGSWLHINPLTTDIPHHIETSQLICIANQVTSFLYDGEHWSLMGSNLMVKPIWDYCCISHKNQSFGWFH